MEQDSESFQYNDQRLPLVECDVETIYDNRSKDSFFHNFKKDHDLILKTEIMDGHLKKVSVLLCDEAIRVTSINTALHWAVIARNKPIIEEILKYDPDLDAVDEMNRTVLHLAINGEQSTLNIDLNEQKKIIEILKFFIDSGSDINAKMYTGETPLWLAVVFRMKEVTQFLIKRGADFNIYDSVGDSIVHALINESLWGDGQYCKLAEFDNANYLDWVLSQGFSADVPNNDDETPLEVSLKNDLRETFLVLLKHAKNLQFVNEYNETILHMFIEYVHGLPPNMLYENDNEVEFIVGLMIMKGVPIDAVNYRGKTALDLAARYRKKHIMQVLLDYSPNLNISNTSNV